MTTLAVVDSHTLIWAAGGQLRKLGRSARRFFDRVEGGHATLYVPTIVLVEVGEAVRRGKVRFSSGFQRWARDLVSSGRYHSVDLTVPIVLRAEGLYAIPERGDRLIAATAAELDCPLLTRDPEIGAAADIEVIW